MRIPLEIDFPGVWSNQTRLGGVGGGLGRESSGEGHRNSPPEYC